MWINNAQLQHGSTTQRCTKYLIMRIDCAKSIHGSMILHKPGKLPLDKNKLYTVWTAYTVETAYIIYVLHVIWTTYKLILEFKQFKDHTILKGDRTHQLIIYHTVLGKVKTKHAKVWSFTKPPLTPPPSRGLVNVLRNLLMHFF